MMKMRAWLASVCLAAAMIGCGGPDPAVDDGGSDASRDDGGTPPADGGRDGGSDGGSDPCEGLTLCTTEGTSCDGDELVTCAENTDGCLVETTEDCGLAGGLCDESGTVAACIDECDLVPVAMRCDTAGRVCDGDTLEICAPNAEGCLALTAIDCTMEATPSECDDTGAMPVCAVPDPCAGITQCGTAETRVCGDTDTITTCAADTNGCFVETTMDCTGGQVCDGATVTCVDPCSLVTDLCPSATYCDGDEVVSCTADVNGCLVEDTRSACTAPSVCRTSGTAAACFDACPEAGARVLDCDSGTVAGDTAVGGTTARPNYACSTFSYAGAEHLYRFQTGRTVRQQVTITSNRISSGSDYDLYVLDGGADATCTTATLECLDSSTGTTAAETVDFVGEPGQTEFVAYDVFNAPAATTTYNLIVTCRDIVCGNGTVEITEACDDGAAVDGDGCSSTCQLEPGYTCAGAPSACTFVCGNGTLNTAAGETCDDANTAAGDGCSAICRAEPGFTCVGTGATSCRTSSPNATCADAIALTAMRSGDDLRTGGFAPTGTGCGSSAGRVLYYSVSVPAGSEVVVAATPTTSFDLTLRSLSGCAAGSCLAAVDANGIGTGSTYRERVALTNTSAAAATYLVAVGADSATTMGTFDIEIESTRTLAANASCAGATALTGTLTGQDQATGGPRPTGTNCGSSTGRVLYYAVSIPANSSATVVATPTTSFNPTLRSLAECGTGNCLAAVDAAGTGTGAGFSERVTIYNTAATAVTQYVAVGAASSTVFGTFDIDVTTTALAANSSCSAATPLTGTLTGQTHALGGPRPTGTGCGSSLAPVVYYSVEIPAGSAAHVVATPTTTFDLTLRSLAECGSGNCLMARDAVPSGTGATAAESITLYNTGTSPITQYVAVGADSSTVFGTFDIAVTSTALAANATCGGAVDLTGTLTGETLPNGGPALTDASCGSGNGSVRYYRVTIPANSTGIVVATPTGAPAWDLVVRQHADCAATTCLSAIDGGTFGAAETLSIANTTASPITRLVSVGSIRAPGPTYDVTFMTYTPTAITAMCTDMTTGTAVAGVTTDDSASALIALPFPLSYFGQAVTHYSVTSNGFLQLWPSSTGTASTVYDNLTMPVSDSPNAMIAPFWDDLRPNTGADVRTLLSGTAGSQVLTIQWTNWRASSGGTEALTFQVQLVEGTNVIELHYCTMTPSTSGTLHTGSSATIGLESRNGTAAVLQSFNTTGAVMSGSGFRYTPNP